MAQDGDGTEHDCMEDIAKMEEAFADPDREVAVAELAFFSKECEKALAEANVEWMMDMASETTAQTLNLLTQLMHWIPATNIAVTSARIASIMTLSDTEAEAMKKGKKELGVMRRHGKGQLDRCATLFESVKKQLEEILELIGVDA